MGGIFAVDDNSICALIPRSYSFSVEGLFIIPTAADDGRNCLFSCLSDQLDQDFGKRGDLLRSLTYKWLAENSNQTVSSVEKDKKKKQQHQKVPDDVSSSIRTSMLQDDGESPDENVGLVALSNMCWYVIIIDCPLFVKFAARFSMALIDYENFHPLLSTISIS